jgi:adenylate kinase family enzyme
MRIAVMGTSGSGKTTLGRRLGQALDLPFIELDAINWQAGWRDLNATDPEEFVRRVTQAIAPDAWVSDGNYSRVRPLIWARATHLIWLDYDRSVIMPRVIGRSLARALDGRELWPGTGNRERFQEWLSPDHPIRWAWRTHKDRRVRIEASLAGPDCAHLQIHRLRRPAEADHLLSRLAGEEGRRSL